MFEIRLHAISESEYTRLFDDKKVEQEKSHETYSDYQGTMNAKCRLKEEYERKIEKIDKAYLAEKKRAHGDRRESNIAKVKGRLAGESLASRYKQKDKIWNLHDTGL